ncbi:MAG TPA: WecB/TagA/CpsF family glycosyltransferase, partial [Pilimelia sp.]|nr:WecB/TagA/CpsF family glycosyltransferase [Pilimelia sp.]
MTVGTGSFHACTEGEVVATVRKALDRGAGGRIITPNVDILRQARTDAAVRAYLAAADFVVADGMPLVWASRLAGTPLPERVCGSSLIWSLAQGLGVDGRSIYVLGGEPAPVPHAALAPAGGAPAYLASPGRPPAPRSRAFRTV